MEQIKGKDYEKAGEIADIILQSSNRAMDLVMNLMTWAQAQSGEMNFNPKRFDIIPLIDEVTLLLNDIAMQKSILIAKTLPPGIQVYADYEMISTVLRNLISNAIKFTPPGGKITISSVEKQNQIVISVNDTGVGISDERIDKLFNISDGYSTPGTQNEKGTGLGLILCKEFVNKNNGEIRVESKAGIGTSLYFSLPLSVENQ
jgi:signal transduction histidine kinase